MAWANGHSERTCRAARPGACGFACAAGREVPGGFAHCTATTCTIEFRKRDQNTGATTSSSTTWRTDEMASALGVAVSDVCWPFAIIMVQSGGDMKKEAMALARCAHATHTGHKSAMDTCHRVPAGMDKAMLQRFVNP